MHRGVFILKKPNLKRGIVYANVPQSWCFYSGPIQNGAIIHMHAFQNSLSNLFTVLKAFTVKNKNTRLPEAWDILC